MRNHRSPNVSGLINAPEPNYITVAMVIAPAECLPVSRRVQAFAHPVCSCVCTTSEALNFGTMLGLTLRPTGP
jgi:hypothetical protein